MNNKNFYVAVVILAVMAVAGFLAYLPEKVSTFSVVQMADFPKTFGDWKGVDIPLTEKEYAILETKNLIMREYKNTKGDQVYLYIVYSEENRKVAHPPEICMTGGGFEITDKTAIQIGDTVRAVKMVVEKGNSRELVLYWFKAGSLQTDQYIKQQLKVAVDRLFLKKTSCAMIRVSADIKDDTPDATLDTLKSFCSQMAPLITQYVL